MDLTPLAAILASDCQWRGQAAIFFHHRGFCFPDVK
jgi:hypothetical protein